MPPAYDLNKIKFGTDGQTFERAVGLYENGKVIKFEEAMGGYSAVVVGTSPYRVFVSARHYDSGGCECYLGQKEIFCKHMTATAIMAVMGGKPLSQEDKQAIGRPVCSGRLGKLSKTELSIVKKSITAGLRHIKSYDGPSRIWFAYQDSLSEGCRRLTAIVSGLPVGRQTAGLLVDTLLRIDEKLCASGVDDSDGTVGDFMVEVVDMLKEYARLDPACKDAFLALKGRSTCFGWEEPLVELLGK